MLEPQQHIEVVTYLHTGISGGGEQKPVRFEATQAGRALSLDFRDWVNVSNQGHYGNIGKGHTEVFLVDRQGDRTPVRKGDKRQWPRGVLTRAVVQQLEKQVWDGHNWVYVLPERCYEHRTVAATIAKATSPQAR